MKNWVPRSGETDTILLIRSARMHQVKTVWLDLTAKYPTAEVSVLLQPEVEEDFRRCGHAGEILTYDNGSFNIFRLEKEFLKKLRAKKFDLIVIPYNNDLGRGYLHVELIALRCRPGRIIAYDPYGIVHEVNLGFLGWKYLLNNLIINPFLRCLFFGYLKVQIWRLKRAAVKR